MVDLPIKIKELRLKKGLNKSKLGALLGVSGTAIGQYESGKNHPKTEVLLRLSKVLNYDFINNKPLINNYNEFVTQENKANDFSFSDARMVNQRDGSKSPYPQKPPHELIQIIQNMQSLNTIQGQQIESLRKQLEKILMNI